MSPSKVLAASLLLGTTAALSAAPTEGTGGRPNVLLISVDTLRPDFLGAYGAKPEASPTIDGLATQGVLFEDVLTTIGKTGPAFASLFSSTFPPTHGARRNGVAMRDDLPVLAEVLRDAGYETAAFISNWTLKDRLSGVARGFEHYDEEFDKERHGFGLQERDAESVTEAALAWLQRERKHTDARPLFLWLHYSDPHSPYELRPVGLNLEPPREERTKGWQKRFKYATEVRYTDGWIDNFLQRSAALFPPQRTLLIFVADHGESLGEHDYWGHGKNVHWPNLRIPLILRGPGIPAGKRVAAPVSIVDVLPTVVDLLALEAPPDIAGKSLAPYWGRTPGPAERRYAFGDRVTAISKGDKQNYEHPLVIAMEDGALKTVYDLKDRELRFYDLRRDPQERKPLSKAPKEERPPLGRQLANWYRSLPKYDGKHGQLTSEDIEQLRSLGYIDG